MRRATDKYSACLASARPPQPTEACTSGHVILYLINPAQRLHDTLRSQTGATGLPTKIAQGRASLSQARFHPPERLDSAQAPWRPRTRGPSYRFDWSRDETGQDVGTFHKGYAVSRDRRMSMNSTRLSEIAPGADRRVHNDEWVENVFSEGICMRPRCRPPLRGERHRGCWGNLSGERLPPDPFQRLLICLLIR